MNTNGLSDLQIRAGFINIIDSNRVNHLINTNNIKSIRPMLTRRKKMLNWFKKL